MLGISRCEYKFVGLVITPSLHVGVYIPHLILPAHDVLARNFLQRAAPSPLAVPLPLDIISDFLDLGFRLLECQFV